MKEGKIHYLLVRPIKNLMVKTGLISNIKYFYKSIAYASFILFNILSAGSRNIILAVPSLSLRNVINITFIKYPYRRKTKDAKEILNIPQSYGFISYLLFFLLITRFFFIFFYIISRMFGSFFFRFCFTIIFYRFRFI